MASCDDDFTLIGDENQTSHHTHHHQPQSSQHTHHHQHLSLDPHRFSLKPHSTTTQKSSGVNGDRDGDDDDDFSETGFTKACTQPFHPFSNEDDPDQFVADSESDPKRTNSRSDKRKENTLNNNQLKNGRTSYLYKRTKISSSNGNSEDDGEYRLEVQADYRKDREEWTDTAIDTLLDAYTDKFVQLNRGNLRGRDWEDVAAIVSGRSNNNNKQKGCKSVEQCKNKVDNLKKRYKVEKQRMLNYGLSVSHWTWFKKIEQIIINSTSSKSVSDEDKSGNGSGSANVLRPIKRYSIPTPSNGGLANNTKSKSLMNPRWRRVVFKISGSALAGSGPQNIDPKVATLIAREVSIACRLGVEVAIVVGGRNFFCGDSWLAASGLDRSTAYQVGMLATVMNSILLQSALEKLGVQTRVQTAFPLQEVAEPYNKRRAIRHLEKGRVVIFGGVGAGTGNPLFTTDTASSLRASELNADAVLKGTNVDGIYDSHSRTTNSSAFEHISFRELVSRGFTSMDMMAITFCEENGIPVVVFNLLEPGNISRALCGQQVGTLIDQAGRSS
ncbi:Uridylate kinase [Thalictrum thalictroides]|uniref:UMP kinase n=1 Tax=Thalictrum thalictroides TaxID=46969 RepID=A0A7J6WAI8_THATH|nr:Uridylate kinase [Thalictrum thalictroides]